MVIAIYRRIILCSVQICDTVLVMAIAHTTACLLLLAVTVVRHGEARPSGAPSSACSTLVPALSAHGSEQSTPIPYRLSFAPELNGTVYTPGQTYTSKFEWKLQSIYLIQCIYTTKLN